MKGLLSSSKKQFLLGEVSFNTEPDGLEMSLIESDQTSIRLSYGETSAEKIQVKMSLSKAEKPKIRIDHTAHTVDITGLIPGTNYEFVLIPFYGGQASQNHYFTAKTAALITTTAIATTTTTVKTTSITTTAEASTTTITTSTMPAIVAATTTEQTTKPPQKLIKTTVATTVFEDHDFNQVTGIQKRTKNIKKCIIN